MARKTLVINVVGLTESLLPHAPRIRAFAADEPITRLEPCLPAVTTAVQSSMLTGQSPAEHGIVGNGWYNRDMCEVQFWKQSNRLVQGEKVWEAARQRDASVTSCNMFWWYNMYSSVDYSVTPRPIYKADGRKIPDCYSDPAELRDKLQAELGTFPLFHFWGPAANITSSRWIADASMLVDRWHDPTLTFIYLPHLDYSLQKLGPGHADMPRHVAEVDAVVGDLIDHYQPRDTAVLIVSEYGVEPVTDAVHVNRVLRREGLLRVRVEQDLELLDAGASDAFAVADHQVAHVYVNNVDVKDRVRDLLAQTDGVEQVTRIDHERAGDFVLVAAPGRWFSYYYWLDDARAPDFARCVDIHRKPGYDPVELFVDPQLAAPTLSIGRRLLMKQLGFRQLMDVVPLDASLVRGSHGRLDMPQHLQPLLIGDHRSTADTQPCTHVHDAVLSAMFEPR